MSQRMIHPPDAFLYHVLSICTNYGDTLLIIIFYYPRTCLHYLIYTRQLAMRERLKLLKFQSLVRVFIIARNVPEIFFSATLGT